MIPSAIQASPLSRRRWLTLAASGAACSVIPWPAATADGVLLPEGAAPPPVAIPHFPTPAHAFIWRNWQLVPAERLAALLGVQTADVADLGRAMGLDEPPPIPKEIGNRASLTIIRRNWHLLPYDQLLSLLGWTAEQLAFTLQEDDFFFVKVGQLKPKCHALQWPSRTEAVRQREAEIAKTVREAFRESPVCGNAPLFSFVKDLSTPQAAAAPRPAGDQLRFCYSYFALYGDPLLEPDLDPFPDGLLQRLSQSGVTGVWLQGVLAKLSPFPWDLAQSERHEDRRNNLNKLVNRAKTHGIKIFLYLNEPRSLPNRFFETRPALKGVTEGGFSTLCTSLPEVQNYLAEAVAGLSRAVPDLGGYFTITASENLTNCWSHHHGENCPRCKVRNPGEVIAEVNGAIARGIQSSGEKQRLLAWDWGWADSWAENAIAKLPESASLMSVSEWSLPIDRGGVKSEIGEYCLSSVGPGPRAKKHWAAARKRGLRVIAKIQAGLTWEFSAAPYLPVLQNVTDHAAALKQEGVEDYMLGWTLGGYPSPNLAAVSQPLAELAKTYCPEQPEAAMAFWRECSRAFAQFPYSAATVYDAPLQFGPANLLWTKPTGYRACMVGLAYDDLASWRSIYSEEVFLQQLDKTAAGFQTALSTFRNNVPNVPAAMEEQLRYAEVASLHWQSVSLQGRYIQHRGNPAQRSLLRDLLQHETALAKRLHALQSADSRIGFEASNQYYYLPLDLVEKVLCCRWLEQQLP